MTKSKQQALETLWCSYGLDVLGVGDKLRPQDIFEGNLQFSIEIGFGDGEHLLQESMSHPDRNYLGIEMYSLGIAQLIKQAHSLGSSNLRVCQCDAVTFLENNIVPHCVFEIYLLFPDPWPKKKHWKRRIISPYFLSLVSRALVPGGKFYFATDWEPYALQVEETLKNVNFFDSVEKKSGANSVFGATKFERKGINKGHNVFSFTITTKCSTDNKQMSLI